MKIGLLFAGQGAQYEGMGESLYNTSAAARKVMDTAGEEIKNWCFTGTKEMLRQTRITQPCIYTVSMAAYEALLDAVEKMDRDVRGAVEITGMAGFSLGEYAALTAAGVIDEIGKGMDIVVQRGMLMNEAGLDADGQPKGGMAAAFGKRQDILACVEEARADGILEAVNFNSPVQTVVAGDKAALERFCQKAATKRIKAKPLSVSTAFHSPMMEPAAAALKGILLAAGLKAPRLKVYSNITGRDLMEALDGKETGVYLAECTAAQAVSPVRWQETIENMAADGIEAVIELGPGATLCGLVKKIAPQLLAMHIEDAESLEKTIAAITERIRVDNDCPQNREN